MNIKNINLYLLLFKMANLTIHQKKDIDVIFFLQEIDKHPLKIHIISMFKKGPPKDQGFMWREEIGGPGKYWTVQEAEALKYVQNLVLSKNGDSSGYGYMMRILQNKLEETYGEPSEATYENKQKVLNEKKFAQNYQKTVAAQIMDDANKKALNVMATEGMTAAVKHMFIGENGSLSYAEMRSKFG